MRRTQLAKREIDTELIVITGTRTTNQKPEDVDRILDSPLFFPPNPKIITPSKIDKVVKRNKADQEPTLGDALQTSALGMDISGKLLDIVRNRSKNLKMKVDPIRQSELHTACKAIFPSFNGTVTFAMFEQALQINRDLMRGLGSNI